jgi:hypothetical protein
MGLKCKVCLQYSYYVDYLTPSVYVMFSSYINAFFLYAMFISFLLRCCDCLDLAMGLLEVSHESDHRELLPKNTMEDVAWVHEGSR